MKIKSKTILSSLINSKYQSFIAIDPGINQLGLAYFRGVRLVEAQVKTVKKDQYVRLRLNNLAVLLEQYLQEKQPDYLVIEKTTFSAAHTGLLILAYYKILAIAKRRKLKVYEYVPQTIRKLVCGSGLATKKDVMRKMITKYPELKIYAGVNRRWKERYYFNLYDAVAAGLAHLIATNKLNNE